MSFRHLICSRSGILQQRMIVEKEILFLVEEFVNVLLSGAQKDLVGRLGKGPKECFQFLLFVLSTNGQLEDLKLTEIITIFKMIFSRFKSSYILFIFQEDAKVVIIPEHGMVG